jgi:o-succinylbenzoate synthase
MKAIYKKYTLLFNQPAGTSRGIMTSRDVWFLIITDEQTGKTGIGEIAPMKGLSCDYGSDLEPKILEVCSRINEYEFWIQDGLVNFPSIRFGLETAILDLKATSDKVLFPSAFTEGKTGIPINGLIWMGDEQFMLRQIEEKIQSGFDCLKLKIGAIDFYKELAILRTIRERFPANSLEIRVDANGAFSPAEATEKLERLAKFHIHSIEQPVAAGQSDNMAMLCNQNIVPVALDEELIGVNNKEQKVKLLIENLPQYIILKPSLHGGIAGCNEWISLAQSLNIGWWITSALESNIGLNAIAQWSFTLKPRIPQGLGTGSLFSNNIDSPLTVKGNRLFFDKTKKWNIII